MRDTFKIVPWAYLVAQKKKNLPECRRPGFDPWVGKILGRREKLTTPVFWPGEFHGLLVHGVANSQTQLSLSIFVLVNSICSLEKFLFKSVTHF